MALEAIPSYSDLLNFIIFDTPNVSQNNSTKTMEKHHQEDHTSVVESATNCSPVLPPEEVTTWVQGKTKNRRRRLSVCRDKQEAETQRMTHIAVERNRRKLMNDHLAVLRSLMPESYAQRGDQASIVGGAIEFVKELEYVVQSLELKKLLFLQQAGGNFPEFLFPSDATSQVGKNKYTLRSQAEAADIEVTLIETHANLRILSRKTLRQLSKMVSGFQTLRLPVVHLNVTSFDPFVLYSVSAKMEEGCQLSSVHCIAEAVQHMMLRIIEEDGGAPLLLA